jgi:hypothetical protein
VAPTAPPRRLIGGPRSEVKLARLDVARDDGLEADHLHDQRTGARRSPLRYRGFKARFEPITTLRRRFPTAARRHRPNRSPRGETLQPTFTRAPLNATKPTLVVGRGAGGAPCAVTATVGSTPASLCASWSGGFCVPLEIGKNERSLVVIKRAVSLHRRQNRGPLVGSKFTWLV